MKIKQTVIGFGITLVSILALVPAAPSLAAQKCAGVTTAIISCSQSGSGTSAKDSGVWGLLILALNILTAGVGILAVGGIVYASILYASASDSAEQTKRAKDIIKNVVIGLLAYAGMYLILNFLIPGGIFN